MTNKELLPFYNLAGQPQCATKDCHKNETADIDAFNCYGEDVNVKV